MSSPDRPTPIPPSEAGKPAAKPTRNEPVALPPVDASSLGAASQPPSHPESPPPVVVVKLGETGAVDNTSERHNAIADQLGERGKAIEAMNISDADKTALSQAALKDALRAAGFREEDLDVVMAFAADEVAIGGYGEDATDTAGEAAVTEIALEEKFDRPSYEYPNRSIPASEPPHRDEIHAQVPEPATQETENDTLERLDIERRVARIFRREDVQLDLGNNFADVSLSTHATSDTETSTHAPVAESVTPVIDRLKGHLAKWGLDVSRLSPADFTVETRGRENHLILTKADHIVPAKQIPAEKVVAETAITPPDVTKTEEREAPVPTKRQPDKAQTTTRRTRTTSAPRKAPSVTENQTNPSETQDQGVRIHPNLQKALEIRARVEEAIRTLGEQNPEQNPTGKAIAALLPDIPERTIGRHLNAIVGQQLYRRNQEQLDILQIAMQRDVQTMSLAQVAKKYKISNAQAYKILNRPTPEAVADATPTPDSVVAQLKPVGRYRSAEQIERLKAAVARDTRAGLSFDDIQTKYELSSAYLAQLRKETGVAAKSGSHITPAEKTGIIRDSATMNIAQLEEKYGKANSNIRRVLYEAGIKQERGQSQALLSLWQAGETRPSYLQLLNMALEAGLTRDQFHHAADYLRDNGYPIPKAREEDTNE